jgi:hypothetical protein
MNENSMKTVDREGMLGALRKAVETRKGQRMTLREFIEEAGIDRSDVFRHFARWEDALREAGCNSATYKPRIDAAVLLADWGATARAIQRVPTKAEFSLRGKHSATTVRSRFAFWSEIIPAFEKFAADKPEWADVMALIASSRNEAQSRCEHQKWKRQRSPWLPQPGRRRRMRDLPVYGSPLDFGGLRHAPVNEQGVVFLFGMMAEQLGFLVESLSAGFPDCETKRQLAPGEWQRVRIEFEFDSRNFRAHGHDPKGCDVIVCWENNWAECPLEVIALRDLIPQREMTKEKTSSTKR